MDTNAHKFKPMKQKTWKAPDRRLADWVAKRKIALWWIRLLKKVFPVAPAMPRWTVNLSNDDWWEG